MAPHIKPHPTTPTFQPSNRLSKPQKTFFIMDAFTHKKTFYYNFFPTKAEEEAERPGIDKQVGRVVIEIRDLPGYYNPPPPLRPEDPQDLLRIRIKSISANEVKNGMLFVSFTDTFEHLFRHWPLDVVSCVTTGQKQIMVSLADVSDCGQGPPAKVHTVYFQRWYGDEYYAVLGLEAVFRERAVKMGDEIGLAWDNSRKEKPMFVLKLLSRGNRAPMALNLG